MKLELKHIAPYLPYELKVLDEKGEPDDNIFILGSVSIHEMVSDNNGNIEILFTEIKPILRPLSYLTKEIEVNGEKFVPQQEYSYLRFEEISNYKGGQNVMNFIQVREQNILFELHFDVFGLIDENLAIDINTLND